MNIMGIKHLAWFLVMSALLGHAVSQECNTLMEKDACCANEQCTFGTCSEGQTGAQCYSKTDFNNNDTCAEPDDQCTAPPSTAPPAPSTSTSEGGDTTKPPSTVVPTTGGRTVQPTTAGPPGTTMHTEAPPIGPAQCSGGGFDLWSFIGGMILVGGLVLLGFLGYKFYKSRTEQRYHQF